MLEASELEELRSWMKNIIENGGVVDERRFELSEPLNKYVRACQLEVLKSRIPFLDCLWDKATQFATLWDKKISFGVLRLPEDILRNIFEFYVCRYTGIGGTNIFPRDLKEDCTWTSNPGLVSPELTVGALG